MQPAINQPIGFWTARAAQAIRTRTRGALLDAGITQPEWWVIHQLSLHPEGMERARMLDTIGPNDTPQAIDEAIASAAAKGWLETDGSSLRPTQAGGEASARGAAVQRALQDERMQGISDDEFVTTITVLQRTIENVGGEAWHW